MLRHLFVLFLKGIQAVKTGLFYKSSSVIVINRCFIYGALEHSTPMSR